MKMILRSISILGLFVSSVGMGAQRVESFSWQVAETPMVKLETFRGALRVEQGAPGRVVLVLKGEATGDDAEGWLQNIKVKGRAFGAGLAIAIKHDSLGVEVNLGRVPVRSVELILRVPQTCNLDVRSDNGSIEVGHDFIGRVRARAVTGDVFIGRVDGDVDAETRWGTLTVARTTGDLVGRSWSGDVTVGTILGNARLRADSGNIDVMSSKGGLKAEAISGNVEAGFARRIERDVELKAQVGDVRVSVDPDSALKLDARASWGQVKSGLDFEPLAANGGGKRHLRGVRNGGGPLMALIASGGNVRIEGVPTYEEGVN